MPSELPVQVTWLFGSMVRQTIVAEGTWWSPAAHLMTDRREGRDRERERTQASQDPTIPFKVMPPQ
jgi:hypothetical protein